MDRKSRKARAKVTTFEDFEKHRNGGEPPPEESSLWEIFNDKVNDATQSFRNKARELVRQEMFTIEAEASRSCKETRRFGGHHEELQKYFNQVVKGGVKGALVAAKILIKNSL